MRNHRQDYRHCIIAESFSTGGNQPETTQQLIPVEAGGGKVVGEGNCLTSSDGGHCCTVVKQLNPESKFHGM